MDTTFSPIENYPFLSPFIFTEDPEKIEKHKKTLLKRLDKVWQPLRIDVSETHEYLAAREKIFETTVAEYYEEQYQKIVEKSLQIRYFAVIKYLRGLLKEQNQELVSYFCKDLIT